MPNNLWWASTQRSTRSSGVELDDDAVGVAETDDARFLRRGNHLRTQLLQRGAHGAAIERGDLDAEVLDVRLLTSAHLLEAEPRVADLKPDALGTLLLDGRLTVQNLVELDALLQVRHVQQHVID